MVEESSYEWDPFFQAIKPFSLAFFFCGNTLRENSELWNAAELRCGKKKERKKREIREKERLRGKESALFFLFIYPLSSLSVTRVYYTKGFGAEMSTPGIYHTRKSRFDSLCCYSETFPFHPLLSSSSSSSSLSSSFRRQRQTAPACSTRHAS